MDQISRIRFKNLLDRMLGFCEKANEGEEKAVLLRIGMIFLNKLRIHADVDSMFSQDVRDLNKQIASCESGDQLVEFMWTEVVDLLQVYRDMLV
jgi:hypothetical protein